MTCSYATLQLLISWVLWNGRGQLVWFNDGCLSFWSVFLLSFKVERWAYLSFTRAIVSKRQDIYKGKYLQNLFLRVTFCGSLLNVFFYEFKGVITYSFDILKMCLIEQQHWMYCRVYWMDFFESSCSLWTLWVEHVDPLLTPPLSIPLISLHLCLLVLFLSCQVHRGSKHKTHIIQTWQEQNSPKLSCL